MPRRVEVNWVNHKKYAGSVLDSENINGKAEKEETL